MKAHVPIIGPLYEELISGHTLLVYLAFVAVVVTGWVLFQTRFGLRLRAAGKSQMRWIRRGFRWRVYAIAA